MIRGFSGYINIHWYYVAGANGVFVASGPGTAIGGTSGSGAGYTQVTLNPSLAVPTGNANKPRAVMVHPCAYVGGGQ
jgi:hypothetical protein